MEMSQALDGRGRNDADEYENEERERQMVEKLNQEFHLFVKKVEETVEGLEFDVPYRDLGFAAVPDKASVLCLPTVNCLVSLSEMPFFLLDMDNVDIAYFERVQVNLSFL